MRGLKSVALLPIFLLLASQVWGQTSGEVGPPPIGSVAKRVFTNVTGKNGYEELVLAGELAASSTLLNEVQQEDRMGTLTRKRQALADPPVVEALALVRAGLNKGTSSPRESAKIDENTVFPEFALFRNLARLLSIQMTVQMADGKVSEATDTLFAGLQLGHQIQMDTLIGGLVGISIDAIMVQGLARYLPMLSLKDCERLLQLVHQWLETPSPALAVISSERNAMLNILGKMRTEPQKIRDFLELNIASKANGSGNIEETHSAPTPLELLMQNNPAALAPLVDEVTAYLSNFFDTLLGEAKKPAWDRKFPEIPMGKNPKDELIGTITVSPPQIFNRYDQDRAQMKMLGAHAAIRRYHWIHDRYPDRLEQLHEDDLMRDPFTGQSLVYKRTGSTYELYSAGPLTQVEGKTEKVRVPLYVPKKPR